MLTLKNLLRRRVRSVLSVLGIGIGIAAIIAFNVIAQGFRESINRYMRESGANLVVVNKTMKDPAFSRVLKEEQEGIAAIEGVEHLSKATITIASPRGLLGASKLTALVVFGRTPGDRLLEKFKRRLEGRMIEADDECMMGRMAAEALGIKVGGTFDAFGRKFKVVGVYDSGVPWEKMAAILPNSAVQKILHIGDSIYMAFLFLKPGADEKAVKRAIEEKFPHLEAVRTEEFTAFYDQIEYIDWFVWTITLVSVIVGGLGILNTMLMSVSERTREIGTLRAVGWSRAQVQRLILSEGLLISAVGGLLGLGVGAAGAEVLVKFAPQGFLGTSYAVPLFVQAFGIAVALGFVGSFYPAWQAGRLSPIEALKYE